MKKTIVYFYLISTVLEGLLVAGVFYDRNLGSRGFLGLPYTEENLSLLTLAVLVSLFSVGCYLLFQRRPGVIEKIIQLVNTDRVFYPSAALFVLVLIEFSQDILFLLSDIKPPHYVLYIQTFSSRLPILIWGIIFSLKSLLGLIILRQKPWLRKLGVLKFQGWIIPFIIFISLWGWMAYAGHGFVRGVTAAMEYTMGHFRPATSPLPGTHVFLVWIIILIAFAVVGKLGKHFPWFRKLKPQRLFIYFMIWTAAYLIWVNVPIEKNYHIEITSFSESPLIPTSDSFYFEKEAFRLLAGAGFSDTSTHVMYSFFLSVLHLLGGNGYAEIVPYQIAVMALVPVFLYKIGTFLHSRFSGYLCSLLFIVRERNHLLMADNIAGVVPHELFSENLALVCVVVFLYLILRWADDGEANDFLPLLAGSVLGASVLIRAELLGLLGFVLVGAFIYLRKKRKIWIRGAIMIIVAVSLMIAPWMVRNWLRTGQISLDKADFISRKIREYTDSFLHPEDRHQLMEVDTDHEFVKSYNKRDRFLNLMSNSLQQSILSLPSGHQPFLTLGSIISFESGKPSSSIKEIFSENYLERYVGSLPFYRLTWDNSLPHRSILPVILMLLWISLGIWFTWKIWETLSLIPLFAFMGHIMIWSMAGYSGGRFIKAVDWVPLLFLSIGISGLSFLLWKFSMKLLLFKIQPPDNYRDIDEDQSKDILLRKPIVLGATVFLFCLSLAVPFSEVIIPPKYTDEKLASIVNIFKDNLESEEAAYLEKLKTTQKTLIYGKAIYPRYFPEGDKYEDDRKQTLPEADVSRVDFYIVGMDNIWVSLPTSDVSDVFPHYTDVIVVGEYVRNSMIDVENGWKPYFITDRIYLLDEIDGKVNISRIISGN